MALGLSDSVSERLSIDSAEVLEGARTTARALALATPDEARLKLSQAFCYRLVAAWWLGLAGDDPEFGLRPLFHPEPAQLPEPEAALAESIGKAAASCDPETAAHLIGSIYTCMLPSAYRASYGSYYTPPQLAARLIEQATAAGVDWTRCRVLDPACGGGVFLAPVARRIMQALPDVNQGILVKNLGNRLHGYEIDPFAAWLSQLTLDAVTLPVCRRARLRLPVVVTVCDSLQRQPAPEGFDLVIGNPPYGRVSLPPTERDKYRRGLFGHANLYGLFTDFALRNVRPEGIIAYVTPTSFLAGEYFKRLRELLGTEAPPVSVDFVASRKGVFEDVLQETLLATYRRGGQPVPAPVQEIMTATNGSLRVIRAGRFVLPPEPSQPWLLPRSPIHAPLIQRLRFMPDRLINWGYVVSTGPLVWNRHKGQLHDRPGKNRYPLIWAECVLPDGQFVFRAQKKNHRPYFEAKSYRDEWLITREPCILLQRTTAKEQDRRLIAAALPPAFLAEHKAVVIENHLNMVRPAANHPSVDAGVVAAFLNSRAADRAFRCVSGSVAVSAYELESLPLPSPKRLSGLCQLIEGGARREQIEAECERLYKIETGGS